MANAERKVNELDQQKEILELEMNKKGADYDPDLFARFNRLENDLFAKMQEWEKVTEELEKLNTKWDNLGAYNQRRFLNYLVKKGNISNEIQY